MRFDLSSWLLGSLMGALFLLAGGWTVLTAYMLIQRIIGG